MKSNNVNISDENVQDSSEESRKDKPIEIEEVEPIESPSNGDRTKE